MNSDKHIPSHLLCRGHVSFYLAPLPSEAFSIILRISLNVFPIKLAFHRRSFVPALTYSL